MARRPYPVSFRPMSSTVPSDPSVVPLASAGVVLAVVVVLAVLAALALVAVRLYERRRRERRPTDAERFERFMTAAEPHLASAPRVHLAARVPVTGDPSTAARPLAVGIVVDGRGDDEAVRRTRASIDAQTVAPSAVAVGTARELLGAATGGAPVVLVDAGDELAPPAVERLGQAWTLAPDVAVLTADEDALDADGGRTRPLLRQGPSADGQLARGAAEGLVAIDPARLAPAAAGLLGDASASRRLLATVAAGPDAELHGHVPLLLLHRRDAAAAGNAAVTAGTAPPSDWDARWGPEDAVRAATLLAVAATGAETTPAGLVRVRHELPERLPSVEVVVLFRDKPELTERCVRSVLDATTYAGDLRVQLVDNGSEDPGVPPMVERLAADPRVSAVRDEQPFNYAALNNAAVARSSAEVVLLLNNDTEVRTPDWIEAMLEHALRPAVGAVGALLLFPDGTVQHAGAAIGLHGYAGHPWQHRRPDEATPLGAPADGVRNWLAVTAACLMVRRSAWDAVGGFDEGFVVAGNDVDLCLRLTDAGMRSVCLPHVELLHDESKTRGSYVDPGDFAASERSYGGFRTIGDPFFSPALSLDDSRVVLRG
jgi:O-antigen biosynthesis protein